MAESCSIYLIRHGIAADWGPDYPDDAKRPLTEEGVERLRAEFRGLRALDVQIDRILTSPLVRAVQTAELLAAGLHARPPVSVADALRPGGRYAAVMAELGRLPDVRSVALVGHEPSMGLLAAGLIDSRAPIPFKKGAMCRVDVDTLPPTSAGALVWLLPPKVLRGLAD